MTTTLTPATATATTTSRHAAACQTALAAVLWGSVGPMVALYPHDAASGFALARLGVGACLLTLLAWRAPKRVTFGRTDVLTLVIGGLSVATFQPLYFEAVHRTGIAVATFVAIGLSPVVTGIAGWVHRGSTPTRRWCLAATTTIAGLGLLALGPTQEHERISNSGIALAALACVSYSLQALTIHRLAPQHGDVRAVGAIFLVGALMLLPTAVFASWTWAERPGLLLGSLFAGVATLALAYRLFAKGVEHLGPPTAVLITLLEPLAAAAFAVLLVGEDMSMVEAAAALLILAGVVMSVLDKQPRGNPVLVSGGPD